VTVFLCLVTIGFGGSIYIGKYVDVLRLNTGFILYKHRLSTGVGCFLINFISNAVDKRNIEFI
jgi:hypothetical protein